MAIRRTTYKVLFIFSMLIMVATMTKGQDTHFSQFYASPLSLSPSLSGATDGGRLIMNYRNQWPGVEKAFSTYSVSFDNYFNTFNSGLGILLIQDKAGTGGLTTTKAALQYSYNIQISDLWQIVPAVQFGYGNRSIDFSKLSFADEQIGGGASGSWDKINNDQAQYVDFASSVLVYNPYFWGGLTVEHLSRPNYSFLGEQMQLSRKYVVFGGVNFWTEKRRRIKRERAFTGSFRVQQQGNFSQADVGAYWFNDPLEVGVWYRGLPIIKQETTNRINQDAIVVSLAYRHEVIRFGYSYDITISGLGWNSAGAHELSLIYEFNQGFRLRNRGRRPAVPCSASSNPLIEERRSKNPSKKKRLF